MSAADFRKKVDTLVSVNGIGVIFYEDDRRRHVARCNDGTIFIGNNIADSVLVINGNFRSIVKL